MRSEDIQAVSTLLRSHLDDIRFDRVSLLSPSREEQQLIRELYPRAIVAAYGRETWDLNVAGSGPTFHTVGMALACNVFMCCADPGRWLREIARGHRYLTIQDLAVARRQGHRHLSPETGDVARWSVSSFGVTGVSDPGFEVYDLSGLARVIDCTSYTIDGGSCTKFAALLDLCQFHQ